MRKLELFSPLLYSPGMWRLLILAIGFLLSACKMAAPENLIAVCASLVNSNGQAFEDIVGLESWSSGDVYDITAELDQRGSEGLSRFPAIEVRFYRVLWDQVDAIQTDYISTETGRVTESVYSIPHRASAYEVGTTRFTLSPINRQVRSGGFGSRQLPPQIEMEILQRHGLLMPDMSEREAREYRYVSQGENDYVGTCEFYDDLSWVE